VTSRVFDCHLQLKLREDRARRDAVPRRSVLSAVCTAFVLVPIAGATEQPVGWLSSALAALALLSIFRQLGGPAALGWSLVLLSIFGLATQRAVPPGLGPAAFVTTVLLCVLWAANRGERPTRGSRLSRLEREAQQEMGRAGEVQVRGVLAHELSDEYVLINGLALPRGSGDIDHLVIGPTGVFLLETKTMAGRIECQPDGSWHRMRIGRGGTSYMAYIGDPAAQAQRNIYAVRECLHRHLPQLFGAQALWVEGLLVFPHPRTELATEHSRIPAVRLDDLTARICQHQPRRPLAAQDVLDITRVLLSARHARPLAFSAQALVEMALALPVLLALLFGTLALSRVVQAHSAIVAIAHEVARAGALAASPTDAHGRMQLRAAQVAPGLGLDRTLLEVIVDASTFARLDGHVTATVRYVVNLRDLPVVGWAPPLEVRARHVEWVDPFRGGIDDDPQVER
jgi:hypothetical protein